MFKSEKTWVLDGYQLCNVCGNLILNNAPCWVLKLSKDLGVYVHLECEEVTDRKGKKKTPRGWKGALKQPTEVKDVLALVEHYQREKQYTPTFEKEEHDFSEYDERDEYGHPTKQREAPSLNSKNLLALFFNPKYQEAVFMNADVERRLLHEERCNGKGAYCRGRYLGDIEEEAKDRTRETNAEARKLGNHATP